MNANKSTRLPDLLKQHETELLASWVNEQKSNFGQAERLKEVELRNQCTEFLSHLCLAAQGKDLVNIDGSGWSEVRNILTEVSRTRGQQGFSPSETATFVFSLKKPLFSLLRRELGKDADTLARETWQATEMLDKLGLFTT
jgi:rsbT co-antagonist protein RsbR